MNFCFIGGLLRQLLDARCLALKSPLCPSEGESEEERGEVPHRDAAGEDHGEKPKQTCSMVAISEPVTKCATADVVEMAEKPFVLSLYAFMKERGTPIERIPHLGFKQINLWRIYKAVGQLGGYDSVTARRLWKNVYDELGGSPGSTSAATCTRRHYERLVLPFERHLRGEENKPLPPGKPRKQYKRNLDGSRASKTYGKRKAAQSEKEISSEAQLTAEAADLCETVTQACLAPWTFTSDNRPDCAQPIGEPGELCDRVYDCPVVVQVPSSRPCNDHMVSLTGMVISPLEKKKRMAQACLSLPLDRHDDKDRPTVIHCSQPLAPTSPIPNCNSSEGSPLPPSSSSSRSNSPYSVSSEDFLAGAEEKPASNRELPQNHSSPVNNARGWEDNAFPNCGPVSSNSTGHIKRIPDSGPQSLKTDSIKPQAKDSAWRAVRKGNSVLPSLTSTASSFAVKPHWDPTSTSGFTKVIPKHVQPLKPTPFPPGYKLYPIRVMQRDDSLTSTKKLHSLPPWVYRTERKDKAKAALPKALPAHQCRPHYNAGQPASYLLTGYERPLRDSWHQPPTFHTFLPSRMRLPSQPLSHQIPAVLTHTALGGSATYSYPNSFPVWSGQTGYALPGVSPIYSHKL